jgi:phage tail-like protein
MSPTADRDDPFGAYHFLVEIDGITTAGFRECSGLCSEVAVIEYRNGNEQANVRKLPGLARFGNIVLKRGVTAGAKELWQWHKLVLDGKTDRRSGSIVLLNEAREVEMRWNFREAWPCRYEGPIFSATANEVAIETLELAIERLELE